VNPETVNRDVRAANAAPDSENANENNGAENVSAANAAPAVSFRDAAEHDAPRLLILYRWLWNPLSYNPLSHPVV
jgi:hypothetical protein